MGVARAPVVGAREAPHAALVGRRGDPLVHHRAVRDLLPLRRHVAQAADDHDLRRAESAQGVAERRDLADWSQGPGQRGGNVKGPRFISGGGSLAVIC